MMKGKKWMLLEEFTITVVSQNVMFCDGVAPLHLYNSNGKISVLWYCQLLTIHIVTLAVYLIGRHVSGVKKW